MEESLVEIAFKNVNTICDGMFGSRDLSALVGMTALEM
jgi:hypothetical protein